MTNITLPDLRAYATALLDKGGFGPTLAAEMADLLVWANARGADSHGVLRIPRYLEMLDQGLVKARFAITEVSHNGAICVLDADRAPGATAMNRAVTESRALAATHGLGWCGVRRTSHAGAIGYFVEQVAKAGQIGIAMTASKPLMGYYGARGEVLSTNPLAIAVPREGGADPIILDMSTAAVALGKIMAAKDKGTSIPKGWAVDESGAETTDPQRVAAVLPMAGAKGSGLSLMIEVLTSILVDNPNIAPALTGGKSGGFNGMVLTIDPAAFGDRSTIVAQVGALATAITALQPAPGFSEVLLPGQRGYKTAVSREKEGVSLPSGTAKRLGELGERLGVAVPAALQ